jgi:hypothetical protein
MTDDDGILKAKPFPNSSKSDQRLNLWIMQDFPIGIKDSSTRSASKALYPSCLPLYFNIPRRNRTQMFHSDFLVDWVDWVEWFSTLSKASSNSASCSHRMTKIHVTVPVPLVRMSRVCLSRVLDLDISLKASVCVPLNPLGF